MSLTQEQLDELARRRAAETPRQTLLRELCEQINLWDQDAVIDNEDDLAEHWLLPAIDRYVDTIAPPRLCCQTRRGAQHTAECAAVTASLTNNPNVDTEGWGE